MLDPGLGKTSTTLAMISLLMEKGEIKKALVVAPLRVAKNVWSSEAKKWEDFNHLKVCDLTEKDDNTRNYLLKQNYDVYTINPEALYKVLNPNKVTTALHGSVANKWGFDMLVIDESTRFADPSTQRFKWLKPLLKYFKRRVILTGTPAPNGLEKLFGQMYIIDNGASLGEYITHFRQMYMHPHPRVAYAYEMNPGASERIYERVVGSLLRMRAKDHLVMPELIFNPIYVKLPEKAMAQYFTLEKDFILSLKTEKVRALSTASLGIKLRQISNGFLYSQETPGKAHIIHDAKMDALEDLVESMQGRPLLVMYEFIEDARRIKEKFPKAVMISGAKDINKIIEDFNAGKIEMLVGHPKSAGHGLNLQGACSDICWFGVTWDLELWLQAIARLWRQGQPSPWVKCHMLLGQETNDHVVVSRLTEKDADQGKLDQALIDYYS